MPKDNVYPFKGPMLWNDATCTAQGFLANFAQMCYIPCNAWLAIYYVCVLVFKLKAGTISRYIEPFFYIFSLVSSLVVSLIYLKDEFYHADPLNTHCYTARYPIHCTWVPDGEECYDNGSYLYTEAGYYANLKATLYYVYAVFGILIMCMLVIIINTYLFEKRIKVESASSTVQEGNNTTSRTGPRNSNPASLDTNSRTIEAANTSQETKTTRTRDGLKFSRIVAFQATLYILTVFIIYIPLAISLESNDVEEGAGVYSRVFLQNFEGFFILCIFLYHKVHNLRRSKNRSNMPLIEALKLIFSSREDRDDFFLENITMVQLESDDIRLRREAAIQAEMDVANEDSFVDDSKPDTADLEKYEGISFASPGVSYNYGDAVSSDGKSSIGPSAFSHSTPNFDDISYDVSKFNWQSVKSGAQESSSNRYYEQRSYADESSC
ncbi:predicted protein [Chaetoceros tenuissimus]|uniref:Uncharacterized protein n=1 Tax=Chaetoceros tenuissimus TaxID=426638 RepID=A0AAD3GZ30_9STRA|nr:predicted protein [Chaetoceros tenuissimus]